MGNSQSPSQPDQTTFLALSPSPLVTIMKRPDRGLLDSTKSFSASRCSSSTQNIAHFKSTGPADVKQEQQRKCVAHSMSVQERVNQSELMSGKVYGHQNQGSNVGCQHPSTGTGVCLGMRADKANLSAVSADKVNTKGEQIYRNCVASLHQNSKFAQCFKQHTQNSILTHCEVNTAEANANTVLTRCANTGEVNTNNICAALFHHHHQPRGSSLPHTITNTNKASLDSHEESTKKSGSALSHQLHTLAADTVTSRNHQVNSNVAKVNSNSIASHHRHYLNNMNNTMFLKSSGHRDHLLVEEEKRSADMCSSFSDAIGSNPMEESKGMEVVPSDLIQLSVAESTLEEMPEADQDSGFGYFYKDEDQLVERGGSCEDKHDNGGGGKKRIASGNHQSQSPVVMSVHQIYAHISNNRSLSRADDRANYRTNGRANDSFINRTLQSVESNNHAPSSTRSPGMNSPTAIWHDDSQQMHSASLGAYSAQETMSQTPQVYVDPRSGECHSLMFGCTAGRDSLHGCSMTLPHNQTFTPGVTLCSVNSDDTLFETRSFTCSFAEPKDNDSYDFKPDDQFCVHIGHTGIFDSFHDSVHSQVTEMCKTQVDHINADFLHGGTEFSHSCEELQHSNRELSHNNEKLLYTNGEPPHITGELPQYNGEIPHNIGELSHSNGRPPKPGGNEETQTQLSPWMESKVSSSEHQANLRFFQATSSCESCSIANSMMAPVFGCSSGSHCQTCSNEVQSLARDTNSFTMPTVSECESHVCDSWKDSLQKSAPMQAIHSCFVEYEYDSCEFTCSCCEQQSQHDNFLKCATEETNKNMDNAFVIQEIETCEAGTEDFGFNKKLPTSHPVLAFGDKHGCVYRHITESQRVAEGDIRGTDTGEFHDSCAANSQSSLVTPSQSKLSTSRKSSFATPSKHKLPSNSRSYCNKSQCMAAEVKSTSMILQCSDETSDCAHQKKAEDRIIHQYSPKLNMSRSPAPLTSENCGQLGCFLGLGESCQTKTASCSCDDDVETYSSDVDSCSSSRKPHSTTRSSGKHERHEDEHTERALAQTDLKMTDETCLLRVQHRGSLPCDCTNPFKLNYVAYLCCAPDDLSMFGLTFHQTLENWGFRIFIAPRDLELTGPKYDNMARWLEERCNGKIIVVLSKNYTKSDECLFLTYFARSLDPDSKKRNIIPVLIDRDVEIPNVLIGLSPIKYNYDFRCGWLKKKLVDAIAA